MDLGEISLMPRQKQEKLAPETLALPYPEPSPVCFKLLSIAAALANRISSVA